MKITGIKAIPFRMPLMETIRWANGTMDYVEHVLVRVQTDEGMEGLGEAVPRPTIYGETQESIVAIIANLLEPLLKGLDPLDLEKIWSKMATVIWNPTAKGAIDVALYDLMGKRFGVPCNKLMGGWSNRVALTHMVGLKDIPAMVEEVKLKVTDGYTSFKLKGGESAKKDITMVQKIREAVGKDIRLYLDANQGYTTQEAIEVVQTLENDLSCIEEPLPVWDGAGRKKVVNSTKVPLLADESVFTVQDVVQQIELGAIGLINVKIPRTGFTLSRKIVSLAEAHNLPLQIGTQGETSLGTVAAAHFASAYKQFSRYNEMTFFLSIKGSLLQEEPVIKEGYMEVPQGPGLGVNLDEDKVNYYNMKK